MSVGVFFLMRLQEVVDLRRSDVQVGALDVKVRFRSKGKESAMWASLRHQVERAAVCPHCLLRQWLERTSEGADEQDLLFALDGTPYAEPCLRVDMRLATRLVGVDAEPPRLSANRLRQGGLTLYSAMGYSAHDLMVVGRWSGRAAIDRHHGIAGPLAFTSEYSL